MLDNFMKELAKELELSTPLSSETPGIYIFPIDDLKIYISETPQGIYLECTLPPFTATRPEELFSRILLENLFGQNSNGTILALAEDGRAIKINKIIKESANYQGFREIFEDFINTVDFWSQESLTYQ